jgi:hypothetical protein
MLMKKIALILFSSIVSLYAMEKVNENIAVQTVVVRKSAALEGFSKKIKKHVESWSTTHEGAVNFSYQDDHNPDRYYSPNHHVFKGNAPILTVYIQTQDGHQHVFLGNPCWFWDKVAKEKFEKKEIVKAIVAIQSTQKIKTASFNHIISRLRSQPKESDYNLFSQVSTLLGTEDIKKYWITLSKGRDSYQSAVLLHEKEAESSCMILEDEQTIYFNNAYTK